MKLRYTVLAVVITWLASYTAGYRTGFGEALPSQQRFDQVQRQNAVILQEELVLRAELATVAEELFSWLSQEERSQKGSILTIIMEGVLSCLAFPFNTQNAESCW